MSLAQMLQPTLKRFSAKSASVLTEFSHQLHLNEFDSKTYILIRIYWLRYFPGGPKKNQNSTNVNLECKRKRCEYPKSWFDNEVDLGGRRK